MKKYSFIEHLGDYVMIVGVIVIAAPFVVVAVTTPIIDYLFRLDIPWYVFYPSVGGALFVLGLGVKMVMSKRARRETALSEIDRYIQ